MRCAAASLAWGFMLPVFVIVPVWLVASQNRLFVWSTFFFLMICYVTNIFYSNNPQPSKMWLHLGCFFFSLLFFWLMALRSYFEISLWYNWIIALKPISVNSKCSPSDNTWQQHSSLENDGNRCVVYWIISSADGNQWMMRLNKENVHERWRTTSKKEKNKWSARSHTCLHQK